jgi:hypothetical protein
VYLSISFRLFCQMPYCHCVSLPWRLRSYGSQTRFSAMSRQINQCGLQSRSCPLASSDPFPKVRTFLPTQFCPQSFCPHFAHTIIKKKSKFGVHVFVNKQDFRGLGDFLWAKCVGKMKMCGQNNVVGWCECRWKSCLSWSRGLASSWWVWRVALDRA